MTTTDSSTPLMEAVKVSSGYGSGLAIRDVSLEVRRGEVVAVLGANGAGKTTTLLTMVGELKPAKGDVLWQGAKAQLPLHRLARKGLCFVPDDGGVFRGLTTRQNLALSRHDDRDSALNTFPELRRMLDRRAGLLSGGEQRMLSVGRALSSHTELMIADELSLGLAPMTVGVLLRAIRQAADKGLGALIVEQHVHRILDIADRVYVMQRGRVTLSMDGATARKNIAEIQAQYLVSPDSGMSKENA
ncbi:amino acid/amide ABC transporter ATP-binding protein 2 (HAAT family) [Arthrobacter sp. SLBN-100]|uniref:ABC transporter ATP-binding protein n=1 Tax=Arthrobacter sp. SLBN-100 TaxID=2768450 RepID=UPI00116A09AA|nr:ATP-binding cassette domain-containing protein [Arthrobacter sp. SLBN-100]TQJ62171.1 amino acid/amide ABC transporter ATP-binding protein 2 (HAAT family) [Arthrobacter sp. SLBN-100]